MAETMLTAKPKKMALALHESDPDQMHQFLTEYGINTGNALFERWRQLYNYILTKNIDGYRKKAEGPPEEVGYPEEWLREVVTDRGEELSIGEVGEHIVVVDDTILKDLDERGAGVLVCPDQNLAKMLDRGVDRARDETGARS